MADTVRTEEVLLNSLFRDGQADNSITAQDMRDLIVSTKYLNGHGWDFHLDGTYTEASPRTILAGVRTQVTIDGSAQDVGHPVLTHSSAQFWNQVTNSINPPNLNDLGMARFAVTAASATSTNYLEVELDVGAGAFPVIWNETAVFSKGAGIPHSFNFNMLLFAGPEFVANGGKIYLTPQNDTTFWNFAITATRLYLAKP